MKNHSMNAYSIFHTFYTPKTPPKASILIVHGMQEHSGRYAEFATFLTDNGFAVLTYDHLGHGKTAKTEEDRGYFQQHKPVERLVKDAKTMADLLREKYPDIPQLILGHSMGSFITRLLLQKHSAQFDAAIIVGTGGKIKGISLLKTFLWVKNLFNPHGRSRFVNNMFTKMNNHKFRNEPDDDGTNWLSLNRKNRMNFKKDPLMDFLFTNNGFFTVLSLIKKATGRSWAKTIRKDLPLLFVSGEDDPIGDFGKDVRKTVANLKEDGFQNVSLKLYPKMRHEILNDDVKEEVYREMLKWMNNNFIGH